MSDFLLGMASPEFWRNGGYALVALGVIGIVAVMLFADHKRPLRKRLALLFVAVLLAGLALARFGESALLAEARERANEAELELAKIKTPRMLTMDAQRRVAAKLRQFAGQEFAGQVAPGSDDARPLWETLDKALTAAGWVRVPPIALPSAIRPLACRLSPIPA